VPRARLELVLYLTHPDLISGLLSKVELSLPSLKKKKKEKRKPLHFKSNNTLEFGALDSDGFQKRRKKVARSHLLLSGCQEAPLRVTGIVLES
jgi:hypothetical protein